MPRVIFHLDMDAFYAAIEQRDRPELKGWPVIVGSPPSQRGVVCAASYEARTFGVRSAMPSATAGRLCPHGVFIAPRIDHYRAESKVIMAMIAETRALIEPMSIDEAYLDMSGVVVHPGLEQTKAAPDLTEVADTALRAALPIARRIKGRIRIERGLTASIGIATNKLLAKLASDFQKPDGLTLISERDKVAFLRPLPVRAIHGVGRVTEQALIRAGLASVGDLQSYAGDLRALVGSWGPTLKRYAMGEDDRPLELGDLIKSISSEATFTRDTADRPTLRRSLWEQAAEVAGKLKRKHLAAHTVQVKVRYGDFSTLTRQVSLEDPLTEARAIYRLGCFLLARDKLVSRPLRLIGLGVSGLREPAARQLTLFG